MGDAATGLAWVHSLPQATNPRRCREPSAELAGMGDFAHPSATHVPPLAGVAATQADAGAGPVASVGLTSGRVMRSR
jgi:hypothetical protein